MTLGEYIAVTRKRNGFTIRQMAAMAGVSNATICQIKTGKISSPGWWNVVKIAKVLNLNLNRLSSYDNE